MLVCSKDRSKARAHRCRKPLHPPGECPRLPVRRWFALEQAPHQRMAGGEPGKGIPVTREVVTAKWPPPHVGLRNARLSPEVYSCRFGGSKLPDPGHPRNRACQCRAHGGAERSPRATRTAPARFIQKRRKSSSVCERSSLTWPLVTARPAASGGPRAERDVANGSTRPVHLAPVVTQTTGGSQAPRATPSGAHAPARL